MQRGHPDITSHLLGAQTPSRKMQQREQESEVREDQSEESILRYGRPAALRRSQQLQLFAQELPAIKPVHIPASMRPKAHGLPPQLRSCYTQMASGGGTFSYL